MGYSKPSITEGATRSRATSRGRAHLHGAPSRHEPRGAEHALNENIMQARFTPTRASRPPSCCFRNAVRTSCRSTARRKSTGSRKRRGRSCSLTCADNVTPHTITPRAHLLSNGSLSVMWDDAGGGYTRWRDVAVTRWREDPTCTGGERSVRRDLTRSKRERGPFWSAGFQPSGRDADHLRATFAPDRAIPSPPLMARLRRYRVADIARRPERNPAYLDHNHSRRSAKSI